MGFHVAHLDRYDLNFLQKNKLIDWYIGSQGFSHRIALAGKGKVFRMLNQSSTMSLRRMWEWRCSSTILDLGTGWR
jgi:hypothetical protein